MAGVKARARQRGISKRGAKRIQELERKLLAPGTWPPSNPKAATARWQLVVELANLKGVPVKVIKKWLEENYPK